MQLAFTLYKDNTSTLRLVGLYDEHTGSYPTDAQVRLLDLLDAEGNQVAGIAVPLDLTYAAGSAPALGQYRATIDAGVAVTAGETYTAVLEAVSSGATGRWELAVEVKTRKTSPAR